MDIFWELRSYASIIELPLGVLTVGTENMGDGVYKLRAGTPISSAGVVANTGDAKYLVAEDFFFYSNTPTQAKNVKVIETGYVDLDKAEAAAGITYTDAAKAALKDAGIVLVDPRLDGEDVLPPVTEEDAGKLLVVGADGEWKAQESSEGLTVDDELSENSINPVQNKVITEEIVGLEGAVSDLESAQFIAFATDTASGPIASFSDGADGIPMKDVVCEINPVQDLHGQDAPYPAGSRKNKLPCPTATSKTVDGITVTTDGYGRFTISGANTAGSVPRFSFPVTDFIMPSFEHSFIYFFNSKATGDVSVQFINNGVLVETWSISVINRVSEYNDMKGAACNEIVFEFSPTFNDTLTLSPMICDNGTETSFSPYSNICPISGFTGLTLARTGKNILPSLPSQTVTTGGITFVVSNDGIITANGTATTYADIYLLGSRNDYENIGLPAGTYKLCGGIDSNARLYFVPETGSAPFNGGTDYTTITIEDGVKYRIFCRVITGATVTNVVFTPMIVANDVTNYSYEPFGNTYPISWQTEAGTVYGGTLDVTTGMLTVDRVIFNGENKTWSRNTSGTYPTFNTTFPSQCSIDLSTSVICDTYKGIIPVSGSAFRSTDYDKCINVTTSGNIMIQDSAYSSLEDFVAAGMTNINVVLNLAPSQTYQLDPVTVTSLLAENNLLHDANGSISATYRADTTLYIDKKFSTITDMLTAYAETSMTASRAYAVNDFVNVNGQLYRVTAPIANGGTITPGTNATAATIGTQLTTIINS